MLFVGYKNGGETVIKLMESGLLDKVIKAANILGCAVAGALVVSYVSFTWNVTIVQNDVEVFNLQKGVFDALVPNLMPLLLTMGVYSAVKKGVKPIWVTFGMMIIGFVLGILGWVA
jgi:PTS system mannose-specific IID component